MSDTDLPAPFSYYNWRTFNNGKEPAETREWQLLSDAHFTGEIRNLGPYNVLNAIGTTSPGRARVALVLREGRCVEARGGKNARDAYHGGRHPEEIAALLSLCTGARVKTGGWTRWFRADGDPLGQPMGSAVHIDWHLDVRRIMLPRTVRTINNPVKLTEGRYAERIRTYPTLTPEVATALVKSARLYQDALWVGETEPHLAWLFLVSAIETAAHQWRHHEMTPLEHFEELKPNMVDLLRKHGGDNLAEAVADEFAPVIGATRKFRAFILEFDPGPPPGRRLLSVNWPRLKKDLNSIYDWRSKALHGGTPFPAPMCRAPLIRYRGDSRFDNLHTAAVAERPLGHSAGTDGAMWDNDETPMLLHVFEHITRGVLLRWWADNCPPPETALSRM